MLIVEGEIKANITADIFGCIVISVPGIGNIGQVLATLAELRVKEVAIAYDKDTKPITFENVARAETRLARLLIDAGYHVAQWAWGAEEAKGIDDLLTAGLWPFPIPHPDPRQRASGLPIGGADGDPAGQFPLLARRHHAPGLASLVACGGLEVRCVIGPADFRRGIVTTQRASGAKRALASERRLAMVAPFFVLDEDRLLARIPTIEIIAAHRDIP